MTIKMATETIEKIERLDKKRAEKHKEIQRTSITLKEVRGNRAAGGDTKNGLFEVAVQR